MAADGRRIKYMGYDICATDAETTRDGFRWYVDLSQIGARAPEENPKFTSIPPAKAFIREELLNEHPFADDDNGSS